MDYMKMVLFKNVTKESSRALFVFKNSEKVNSFDNDCIVPVFMLIEAVFQTAGKVAREFSGNVRGAYVVSFNNLKFERIAYSYEIIEIHSKMVSVNTSNGCFFFNVSAYIKNEVILESATLILKQSDDIRTDYLNNNSVDESIKKLKKLKF